MPVFAAGATPKPPKHLKPATRKWFVETIADYPLEPHHVRLLTLACEAYDRADEARQALAVHGLVYTDRFGTPRARPEAAIERDSRLAFARLVRELGLDAESAPSTPRPPDPAKVRK